MHDLKPTYLELHEKGELRARVQQARSHFQECFLCPHQCGVDRNLEIGYCRAPNQAVISSYGPHFGEEQILVGFNGSGTIFFSYCTMRCVYCQNWTISQGKEGKKTNRHELARIMLYLQEHHRCHNINLVTPTHFLPHILEGMNLAVERGLHIPIVYNCGGYENLETLKMLKGIIDIYMPDLKYSEEQRARTYSKVENYPQVAKEALKEMNSQVGGIKTDSRGVAYRGLLIRHLMLPGGLKDTIGVLQFIKDELDADCVLNLMMQYYPAFKAHEHPEIACRLSYQEYHQGVDIAKKMGLRLV